MYNISHKQWKVRYRKHDVVTGKIFCINISTILCTRHKYNVHKIIAIYRASDIKTRYTNSIALPQCNNS